MLVQPLSFDAWPQGEPAPRLDAVLLAARDAELAAWQGKAEAAEAGERTARDELRSARTALSERFAELATLADLLLRERGEATRREAALAERLATLEAESASLARGSKKAPERPAAKAATPAPIAQPGPGGALSELSERLRVAEEAQAEAERRLDEILRSRSWRITGPLRRAIERLRS
jgi:DNA repair exonuclease SbcCD ATPase subunit